MSSAANDLAKAVLGFLSVAEESLMLKVGRLEDPGFGLPLSALARVDNGIVNRRCLLPTPGFVRNRAGELDQTSSHASDTAAILSSLISDFRACGWDTRLIADSLTASLVIDRDFAIAYEYLNQPAEAGPWIHENSSAKVDHYASQFELHWGQSFDVDRLDDLYSYSEGSDGGGPLPILDLLQGWEPLIAKLARSPRLLHELTPRSFEELVADLLARDGLQPTLTPVSGDGGRDILVYHNSPLGRHLYLVECKKWSPDRPIGVAVVRQLYGVVSLERATAGLIVSTSSFTKGATDFANTVPYQMQLRGYEQLLDWLKVHGGPDPAV